VPLETSSCARQRPGGTDEGTSVVTSWLRPGMIGATAARRGALGRPFFVPMC
jgi:hypothetical protein